MAKKSSAIAFVKAFVKAHIRNGKKVRAYTRGGGRLSSKSSLLKKSSALHKSLTTYQGKRDKNGSAAATAIAWGTLFICGGGNGGKGGFGSGGGGGAAGLTGGRGIVTGKQIGRAHV